MPAALAHGKGIKLLAQGPVGLVLVRVGQCELTIVDSLMPMRWGLHSLCMMQDASSQFLTVFCSAVLQSQVQGHAKLCLRSQPAAYEHPRDLWSDLGFRKQC